ncbi:MAG: carboxy terminal-processing peptidase [Pirellulaceae bacterium]
MKNSRSFKRIAKRILCRESDPAEGELCEASCQPEEANRRQYNIRVRWLSLGLVMVVAAVVAVGVLQYCRAEIAPPTAEQRFIAKFVADAMPKQHLSHDPLSDETSERAFKIFFKSLDPRKLYFYQSDVDAFRRDYATELDEMVSEGDTKFAQVVFKRFLQRVDERVAMIEDLLEQDFDFTRDEEMVTDAELVDYPKDAAEARERWRKRLKYELLLRSTREVAQEDSGEEEDSSEAEEGSQETESPLEDRAWRDAEVREELADRYRNFQRRMKQYDNDELLERYLTAVTTSYDPHTTYMSPASYENFLIMMRLSLEGIGAVLQDKEGQTTVVRVVPGGAAAKHGKLKKNDRIISVGQGKDGEMVDIVGMNLSKVVEKIRGEAGTIVRLGVIPANKKESVIYEITRAKIELEDSAAHGEVFEVDSKPNGKPLKVGVIDLPSFYQDMKARKDDPSQFKSATHDVERLLAGFKEEGVDAVVLDLRSNGGGSLIEAVELTGLFIDQGTVVQVKKPKSVTSHADNDPGMAWDGPLVVVTSKLSASASEILAGAIQDYQRGLVVGDESTHGKGTVQTLVEVGKLVRPFLPDALVPNYGALKITVQQFFRPNGDSTQKRGVLSDVVLPSITNHMDIGEADLDYAIDFKRIERGRFTPVGMVKPTIVDQVRAESRKRIDQSEDFAKVLERIEAFKEQKASKKVTLNAKAFFEEDDLRSEKEETERLVEEQQTEERKIERDFYLDEVLKITRDYVNALGGSQLAHTN